MTAKCTCRIVYHPPREAPKDHRPVPWQPCIEQKCNLCESAPELLEACKAGIELIEAHMQHFEEEHGVSWRGEPPALQSMRIAIQNVETPMKGEPK